MDHWHNPKVEALLYKGVEVHAPQSVTIDTDVDVARISGDRVVIHGGCRISGPSTLIGSGSVIGREGPVTLEDCQLGSNVELRGGYFNKSVFLDKASMGFGAHVRAGTILEEAASGAHTVALKQTILFPFVTLGSLINFCDCLMAGGTSRQDHSEVGSSFIHFNYTPNQDKATASLIGDVPNGVMLDQRPIFLGGQGGLVGPCRLAFGTVTAAGTICRKDELRPGRLVFERGGKGGSLPFTPGQYRNVRRIVTNNVIYIGNLLALMQWYRHVRSQFVAGLFPEALLAALIDKLTMGLDERRRRLGDLLARVPDRSWADCRESLEATLAEAAAFAGDAQSREQFLETLHQGIKQHGKGYLTVIKALAPSQVDDGRAWLQGIVDFVVNRALQSLPQ